MTEGTVWDYFVRSENPKERRALCKLCDNTFSCSTSFNLKMHLKSMHSDVVDVGSDLKRRPPRKRVSLKRIENLPTKEFVFKYFAKVEGDKLACCNFCNKIFSYKSTIANLNNHLRNVHRDIYNELVETVEEYEVCDGDDNDDGNSDDDQQVQMTERSEVFQAEETSTEQERKDNLYTEIIYLEDEIPKHEIKIVPSANKKRKINTISTNENRNEKIEMKAQEIDSNDELDKFGAYIVCLLRTVPKATCTKLQMKIVNEIMMEKLKVDEKEKSSKSDIDSSAETGGNSDVGNVINYEIVTNIVTDT